MREDDDVFLACRYGEEEGGRLSMMCQFRSIQSAVVRCSFVVLDEDSPYVALISPKLIVCL